MPDPERPYPRVWYYRTEFQLEAAARYFTEAVVEAQVARGRAKVVLTGGGTGIGMLEKVRRNPGGVNWSRIDFYWGDERFVPADDPDRNELQAREAMLEHLPIRKNQIFPMPAADGPYADPDAAAAAYAEVVADLLPFDLHMLGMGPDGHINSLFPHHAALAEKEKLVVAVTDSPKPPPVRLTLTLPAVLQTRRICFVVSGEAKADTVALAVDGLATPEELPAVAARGLEGTDWLVDYDAAEKIARPLRIPEYGNQRVPIDAR